MSRSERLLDLLQVLARHRRPVTGRVLAAELGVSLRTLYRDIGSLQALGASIEGEAGLGYVLRPGFLLPPLMFTPEELEALVLGSRWVAARADEPMRVAAHNALARMSATLPPQLQRDIDAMPLLVGPGAAMAPDRVPPLMLRKAIRLERKLILTYHDAAGAPSERTVWPFAFGYFDAARILVAWCELREGFRHFRTDRIERADMSDMRYPTRRQALLAQWKAGEVDRGFKRPAAADGN